MHWHTSSGAHFLAYQSSLSKSTMSYGQFPVRPCPCKSSQVDNGHVLWLILVICKRNVYLGIPCGCVPYLVWIESKFESSMAFKILKIESLFRRPPCGKLGSHFFRTWCTYFSGYCAKFHVLYSCSQEIKQMWQNNNNNKYSHKQQLEGSKPFSVQLKQSAEIQVESGYWRALGFTKGSQVTDQIKTANIIIFMFF